jgi:UDP-N-acetylglucosamine 2-epimerase (non-hydrolysing)
MLQADKDISVSILATGALLSDEYGHQVDLIYKDGFNVEAEINIDLDSSSNVAVTHSMAIALDEFGKHFNAHKYDLLIILGDRFEMMSVALAAAIERIPILHIHGGEATFGNYDEFIRHSITKMASYHFTATEEYKNRVIQLGENPKHVFNLGSLGAENCLYIDENAINNEVKTFVGRNYFVIIYNPETLLDKDATNNQIQELLSAIDKKRDYEFVFLGSNADTYSNIIRSKIHKYVSSHSNTYYFENLPTDDYHYLLKNSCGLIGNSSSGIIEAPSLGVCTVNIGDRQAGRVRGNSVIDTDCRKDDILIAINKAINMKDNIVIDNPYYLKNAAKNYYKTTKKILSTHYNSTPTQKVFYDLPIINKTRK